MSSDKKPKFGIFSKQVNHTKKTLFYKICRKIYVEKTVLYELFDAAAPCCHNTLKPGPEPAGDPWGSWQPRQR